MPGSSIQAGKAVTGDRIQRPRELFFPDILRNTLPLFNQGREE